MSGVAAFLIVAAGKGERAGGAVPKQYAPLLGKPMLRWTVEAFARHPRVTSIQVAIGPDQEATLRGGYRRVSICCRRSLAARHGRNRCGAVWKRSPMLRRTWC